MRHTWLFLLLTMPVAWIFSPAATAHDNPFLIRALEPPVLPPKETIDIDDPRGRTAARAMAAPADRLLGASVYGEDRLAKVVEDELFIPPLIAPTTDQSKIGNSTLPEDAGQRALHATEPLPEGPGRGPDWSLTAYLWQAPNTFSNPLYFEDVMLERHGHQRFPHHLQPLASGARFFATVPALPYLMAVRDPHECYYHLGYYRVGSCAPPLLQRPPYERRAAILGGSVIAAGVVTGAVVAVP